jgi:hypothetical protein
VAYLAGKFGRSPMSHVNPEIHGFVTSLVVHRCGYRKLRCRRAFITDYECLCTQHAFSQFSYKAGITERYCLPSCCLPFLCCLFYVLVICFWFCTRRPRESCRNRLRQRVLTCVHLLAYAFYAHLPKLRRRTLIKLGSMAPCGVLKRFSKFRK